ncbi:MAG: hypothetical protein GY816_19275 [Cytophagales bacterium]|nr:hypothetical protein [Cytophagales bacterium]
MKNYIILTLLSFGLFASCLEEELEENNSYFPEVDTWMDSEDASTFLTSADHLVYKNIGEILAEDADADIFDGLSNVVNSTTVINSLNADYFELDNISESISRIHQLKGFLSFYPERSENSLAGIVGDFNWDEGTQDFVDVSSENSSNLTISYPSIQTSTENDLSLRLNDHYYISRDRIHFGNEIDVRNSDKSKWIEVSHGVFWDKENEVDIIESSSFHLLSHDKHIDVDSNWESESQILTFHGTVSRAATDEFENEYREEVMSWGVHFTKDDQGISTAEGLIFNGDHYNNEVFVSYFNYDFSKALFEEGLELEIVRGNEIGWERFGHVQIGEETMITYEDGTEEHLEILDKLIDQIEFMIAIE